MINYNIPLKGNQKIYGVLSVLIKEDSSKVTFMPKGNFEFKNKNYKLVFVDPATLDLEIFDLKEQFKVGKPLENHSFFGVVKVCGMDVQFLMKGQRKEGRVNMEKLRQKLCRKLCSLPMSKKTKENSLPQDKGEKLNIQEAKLNNTQEKIQEETNNFEESTVLFKEEDSKKATETNSTVNTSTNNDDSKKTQEDIDYVESIIKDKEDPRRPSEQIYDYLKQGVGNIGKDKIITVNYNKEKLKDIDLTKEVKECEEKGCEFVNPFSKRWQGAWWKVKYPDKDWYYIVGRIFMDQSYVSVLGIPGERNNKPVCMDDFDLFAKGEDGMGYWLIFQR